MDIIGTAFKLGSGEISLGKAVKDVGNSISASYGAIISSGIGFSGGMALATTIGLGTIGTVGTILTGGLALVAGAVCGVIGSNIALKITNGLGEITEKVIDKAVDIVKSGINRAKNTLSSTWSGAKTFVRKLFNW